MEIKKINKNVRSNFTMEKLMEKINTNYNYLNQTYNSTIVGQENTRPMSSPIITKRKKRN